jgi:hypothetical protein
VRLIASALRLSASSGAGKLSAEARLDADLTVLYDGVPRPSGTLKLSDGAIAIGGEHIGGLTARGTITPGKLELDKLSLTHRHGRLDASATLALEGLVPRAIDARLHAKELPFSRANIGVWLDGDATLHLERGKDGLTGLFRLERGGAHLSRAGAGRDLQPTGPLADVTIKHQHAGVTPISMPTEQTPLKLRIEVPGPFRIASPELELDARAALTIDTREGIEGSAEALPGGYLEIIGRRYEIDHARVQFARSWKPTIDLRVTREVGDTLIILDVTGPSDDLKPVLSSDPPSDAKRIGAIMMSGDARSGSDTGVLTSIMGQSFTKVLPLDVVKLEPGQGNAPTRFELGRYFWNDRLYVAYALQFGGIVMPNRPQNLAQIEARLTLVRRLSLDVYFGDALGSGLALTYTLRR